MCKPLKVTSVNGMSGLDFIIVNIDVHKNKATIENPYIGITYNTLLVGYVDYLK